MPKITRHGGPSYAGRVDVSKDGDASPPDWQEKLAEKAAAAPKPAAEGDGKAKAEPEAPKAAEAPRPAPRPSPVTRRR